MDRQELDIIIKGWLKKAEAELIKNYRGKGLKSSGNFEKSITDTIDYTSEGVKITILGPDYVHQMVNGRKKGTYPPFEAIKRWVQNKGIGNGSDSLAYAIMNKIKKEGIKVPNFYNDGNLISDTFNSERINELIFNVSKVLIKGIKEDIKQNIK